MLFRIWALLRAAITCPVARTTKLVISCAMAPISPGLTEDLAAVEDVPDGASELTELPPSLLLLALDILNTKIKQLTEFSAYSAALNITTRKNKSRTFSLI